MIPRDVYNAFLSQYNGAVFPAQIILYLVGIGLALAVFARPGKATDVAAKITLAILWLWCGAAFFFWQYGRVNSAGYVWGGVFALQALYFVIDVFMPRLTFKPYHHRNLGHLGATLAGWAFIGYPLLALVLGQRWPALQLFGAATPLVIYTSGLLLLTFDRKPRWRFLFIPVLWSFVGGFGSPRDWRHWEDYSLLAAGLTLLAIWIWGANTFKEKKK